MSTQLRRRSQRPLEHAGTDTLTDDSRSESLHHDSFRLASTENALDECVGAISLVEVTVHSLDSQEIASPEQEVRKRELRALGLAHNWTYDRAWPDTPTACSTDRERQP